MFRLRQIGESGNLMTTEFVIDPKMLTNLPAGKAFIMPREKTMNGTVVIDGSWDANLVDEPTWKSKKEWLWMSKGER